MNLFKKVNRNFPFNRYLTIWGIDWILRHIPHVAQIEYEHSPNRLLYVPASSLPYHISGYTTRTHAVIRALRDAGTETHVLTRPGYPWDRKDRVAQPESEATVVDGVTYVHARGPANNRPVLLFALQASKVIAAVARKNRVTAIHAASNHTNALPALIAARKLGIPFHYELRGLWELTRVSRMPEFKGTQAYLQGLALEGLVARNADRVFIISSQLGHYLTDTWGIATERMTLLPNCIDPEHFIPADPDKVEPNTIGYAGSLMPYEGLDTLISATGLLKEQGTNLRVHIIGDGESKPLLEEQVQRLGLTDRIRFFGKVPPDSARELLGRCAVVCIPRKPFQVCEIVPPIKLVEALAMAKPVIVPDLPVFRDELGGAPVGWFFQSGDTIDLARVVQAALGNQEELVTRGLQARKYAVANRCWHHFVPQILSH